MPAFVWPWTKTSTITSPTSGQTFVPLEPTDPGSSPAPLVAVVGGFLGGIICICLFALALCWRWRRGKRRGSGVRPARLASEDASSLGTPQDTVQPWVESLQDYITSYLPPAIPIHGG